MSDSKSEYQQGRVIESLSDEDAAKELETQEILQVGEQINTSEISLDETLLVNDPIEQETESYIELDSLYVKKTSSVIKKIFVLSFATVITVELGLTVYNSFNSSIILGILYSSLIASAFAITSGIFIKEYRQLRKLKSNQLQRTEAHRLLHSQQLGEAISWLEKLNKYQKMNGFSEFKKTLQVHHTDKEVMTLYCNTLLVKQDEQAQKLINKYALESGLMVALSPIALVDMAAVLWRGSKLIENIAKVYGIPLGYVSRLKLYRLLLKQMLFAGTTELVSDLATTVVSAELAGKISARAGQGISVGILTARIGYKAMELSRPIPELKNKQKFLSRSMKLLLSNIVKKTQS
ncbi:TIGR01620 family protein [Pseudoalteromonas denitrificans]|uniref:Putative membrane protein n=1 Tax=Pseudoalteromonas denitrificans DSM 6059 TaxID=1123010 RepID=A0A1I1MXJ9_9GAMM|nr:TIGR01620 family protein [Pseudoalteromonas denitrificans]SFC86270.1 putative membrane protein [Pseudoalteromonas denitrificans DSM 6059]